jgi:tellurite resistance protein TerC
VDITATWWLGTLAVIAALMIVDLTVSGRHSGASAARSVRWVLLYVACALAFGLVITFAFGPAYGGQFIAGWLTEYSLSVDNLFVFLVLMTRFAVPDHLQLRVLSIGILLALVLRAVLIAVGAAALDRFSWLFFLFAAFLLYTAWNLLRTKQADADEAASPTVVGLIQRVLPSTPVWHGSRPFVRAGGRWLATPMLITMISIGVADVLFALDSIPAIFGLTREPFLVISANAFALMGLRQLFFVVRNLLDRLRHLDRGLAVVLAFIGVKLVLEALHENSLPFVNGGEPVPVPVVPTAASLGVIVFVLAVTTITSLVAAGRDARGAPRPPTAGPRPPAAGPPEGGDSGERRAPAARAFSTNPWQPERSVSSRPRGTAR